MAGITRPAGSKEQGKKLFVTSGVGTSIIPVRFRVPPEMVFVEIRPRR